MGVVGLSGVLLFCSGAHVLWRSRKEILDWLQEFVRIFRNEFSRRGDLAGAPSGADAAFEPPGRLPGQGHGGRGRGALRLVGAVGLMFLGQVLFLLDLAF